MVVSFDFQMAYDLKRYHYLFSSFFDRVENLLVLCLEYFRGV